jgi:hypothetical protein
VIEILAILAPLILGAVVGLHSHFRWRRSYRAGAAKMYREMTEMYRGEHEYRIASEGDFPGLELSGYKQVEQFLRGEGFRHLGSFENLTVTRIHPEHRTRLDSYASTDGPIGLTTFRLVDRQIVNFGSVLQNDRLVITTNADLDTLIPPPTVNKCTLPSDTSIEELLSRHRQRVEALHREDPTLQFLTIATLDEVIALSKRQSRIASAHRQSLGYLTRAEMLSFATRLDQERGAKAIWEEFRRLVTSASG